MDEMEELRLAAQQVRQHAKLPPAPKLRVPRDFSLDVAVKDMKEYGVDEAKAHEALVAVATSGDISGWDE